MIAMARKGLLPDWVQMALVDTSASLPVSGLDERTATSIMFTLEQSMGSGDGEAQVALQWLAALQCCQALSDRLLKDMEQVELALNFWHDQLEAGGHSLFMLLGLGPITFLKGILRIITPRAHRLTVTYGPALSNWARSMPPALTKHLPPQTTEALQEFAENASNRLHQLLGQMEAFGRTPSSLHRPPAAIPEATTPPPGTPGDSAAAAAPFAGGEQDTPAPSTASTTAAAAQPTTASAAVAAAVGAVPVVGAVPEDASEPAAAPAASEVGEEMKQTELTAADRMEQRVLMLQSIRASLADALSRVHAAAHILRLDSGLHTQVCAALTQRRSTAGGMPARTFAAAGLSATAVTEHTASVVEEAAWELQKAASEATRVVTTELVAVLSDLAHQQSLITGAVVSDPDADAPSHRTVLQLAAVNRTLTGSPSLARALPLGGYQGSPTGHASPRNSVDSVLHTTIVSAATTSPAPASSTPAAAGAASRSAFEPAAGAGAIAGRSAGHASLVGGAPSLARNHSQREAYPDRVVLHRLAAVGLQAQSAKTGLALLDLGNRLGLTLAITPHHNHHGRPSHHLPHHRPTVRHALHLTKFQAAGCGPLVPLPHWVQRPSRLQRHWLRFTAAALLGLWAARWVYRHSALSGSDDLSRWTREALEVAVDSLQVHVVQPLLTVRDELTHTFRDRPSIVSPAEFEADKASLLRMLEDFQADTNKSASSATAASSPPPPSSSTTLSDSGSGGLNSEQQDMADGMLPQPPATTSMSSEQQDALSEGMREVMAAYEREMRAPVRNLLMGQLVRSLLIQVQRLKLDTEAAMLEMDQILRANELSLSLMAAVPSLLIAWGLLDALYRWLLPAAPDAKRAAVPCRMAMADLERAIAAEVEAEGTEAAAQAQSPGRGGPGIPDHAHFETRAAGSALVSLAQGVPITAAAPAPPATPAGNKAELEGLSLFHVFQVYRECFALFRAHDKTSRHSEWPSLSADLLHLAAASSATQRMVVHQRMMRNYKIFQR